MFPRIFSELNRQAPVPAESLRPAELDSYLVPPAEQRFNAVASASEAVFRTVFSAYGDMSPAPAAGQQQAYEQPYAVPTVPAPAQENQPQPVEMYAASDTSGFMAVDDLAYAAYKSDPAANATDAERTQQVIERGAGEHGSITSEQLAAVNGSDGASLERQAEYLAGLEQAIDAEGRPYGSDFMARRSEQLRAEKQAAQAAYNGVLNGTVPPQSQQVMQDQARQALDGAYGGYSSYGVSPSEPQPYQEAA